MSEAEKCIFCGEPIPEGIQVCPLCEKNIVTAVGEKEGYDGSKQIFAIRAFGNCSLRRMWIQVSPMHMATRRRHEDRLALHKPG